MPPSSRHELRTRRPGVDVVVPRRRPGGGRLQQRDRDPSRVHRLASGARRRRLGARPRPWAAADPRWRRAPSRSACGSIGLIVLLVPPLGRRRSRNLIPRGQPHLGRGDHRGAAASAAPMRPVSVMLSCRRHAVRSVAVAAAIFRPTSTLRYEAAAQPRDRTSTASARGDGRDDPRPRLYRRIGIALRRVLDCVLAEVPVGSGVVPPPRPGSNRERPARASRAASSAYRR